MWMGSGLNMVFKKIRERLSSYGKLVMFSHTIFSLPFGLISMIWAAEGIPSLRLFIYIIVALVAARNGANAFNRIADRNIDPKNKRTANRPLNTGKVKLGEAWAITVFCFMVLAFCAWKLNILCLMLLPLALFIFFFYSYTKRFTWLCHFILGLACGGAPVGAWAAVTGSLKFLPFALGGAVCFWVAGFDIIYATQDIEFDRKEGLHSVPARFGFNNALWIARFSHAASIGCLLFICLLKPVGILYLAGVAAVTVLLFIEHIGILPENKEKMNFVTYNMNQIVSVTFFVFSMLDFFLIKEKITWISSLWG